MFYFSHFPNFANYYSNLEVPMKQYMTTEEVAEYLSIPLNTIYQWRTRGTGPRASRIGRHLRWSRAEVDRWIEQRASDRA